MTSIPVHVHISEYVFNADQDCFALQHTSWFTLLVFLTLQWPVSSFMFFSRSIFPLKFCPEMHYTFNRITRAVSSVLKIGENSSTNTVSIAKLHTCTAVKCKQRYCTHILALMTKTASESSKHCCEKDIFLSTEAYMVHVFLCYTLTQYVLDRSQTLKTTKKLKLWKQKLALNTAGLHSDKWFAFCLKYYYTINAFSFFKSMQCTIYT